MWYLTPLSELNSFWQIRQVYFPISPPPCKHRQVQKVYTYIRIFLSNHMRKDSFIWLCFKTQTNTNRHNDSFSSILYFRAISFWIVSFLTLFVFCCDVLHCFLMSAYSTCRPQRQTASRAWRLCPENSCDTIRVKSDRIHGYAADVGLYLAAVGEVGL